MSYQTDEPIKLTRDCQVVAVPAGHTLMLPQGTEVMITQSLGGSYTLMVPSYGGLFRLSNRDADAIGRENRPSEGAAAASQALTGEALEKEIWQTLKTCFDPEIPVNIVDLGLIYDMEISQLADGSRIDVKMTLTAQGCGMGGSIAADARNKLLDLPGVVEADVQVVWDPPGRRRKYHPKVVRCWESHDGEQLENPRRRGFRGAYCIHCLFVDGAGSRELRSVRGIPRKDVVSGGGGNEPGRSV